MREWIALAQQASNAAKQYQEAGRSATALVAAPTGKPDAALIEQHQRRVHGLAWIGTTVAALEAITDWAARAENAGRFGETEELTLKIGFGEYCHQLVSAVPMERERVCSSVRIGRRSRRRRAETRRGCGSVPLERQHSAKPRSACGSAIRRRTP